MAGMMLAAVNCLPFEQIDHKFLESGHTQMEVDSMHAVIERTSHSAEIFVPRDWVTIASVAKVTGQPYRVRTMASSDFIDFKSMSSTVIRNKNRLESSKRLNWMQCKWLQFRKGSCTVGIKDELDDSPFEQLCATNIDAIQFADRVRETMEPMYTCPVPISDAKYKDLQHLCKTKVIPEQFHQFYNNLKYCSRVADKLDEPDVEEDSDTNDDTEVNCREVNKEDTALSNQVITSVPSRVNKENGTDGQQGTSEPSKFVQQSVVVRKRMPASASRRSTKSMRLTSDVQIANGVESCLTQSRLRKHNGVTTSRNQKSSSVPTYATRELRKCVRLTPEARFDSDHQQSCESRCKQKKSNRAMVRMRK